MELTYESLYDGQEIEMYHHFHSANNHYYWRKGTVECSRSEKLFKTENSVSRYRILPHRMDEIRLPNKRT